MLKGAFFTIQSQKPTVILEETGEKQHFTVQLKLNPLHPIYKGHFPGNPVVPGVCQIMMMREILEWVFGKSLMVVHAVQVKFMAAINPEVMQEVEMEIAVKQTEALNLEVSAVMVHQATALFKFRGSLCSRPS
jgi:3-hydroxyacyl-[acyl-carrier-protein] dehydratase